MTTKLPKKPAITKQTKLLSFDLETNGLHGQAFAVGALVIDASGMVHDSFSARCRLTAEVDPWVKANVLPAIAGMPITHKNYTDLREAFWAWYLQVEPKSDYVLVNNGYPVEYRFLLDCQEADIDKRYWQHPFPILDLSSLLIQVGSSPLKNKNAMFETMKQQGAHLQHHPLHDAKMAALMAFEAFRLSSQLDT